MAAEPKRISVQDARNKFQSPDPFLLVCVYPKDKHAQANLEGSIGIEAFQAQAPTLSKTTDIAFY